MVTGAIESPKRLEDLHVRRDLVASLLLIAAAAMVSMCWQIHPLLTVGAVIALGWLGYRGASLFLTSGRRMEGRPPR